MKNGSNILDLGIDIFRLLGKMLDTPIDFAGETIAPIRLSAIKTWLSGLSLSKKELLRRGAYVIGYPKSGTTWLRLMVGKYFQLLLGENETTPLHLFDHFEDISPRLPLICFSHGELNWTFETGPDLSVETHLLPYRNYQTVLLVRNIPDTLVSNYWHLKTRANPPYAGEIHEFIRDKVHGVEKAIGFFRVWSEAPNVIPRFLLLRYEDLKSQPSHELQRLLEFWQIPVDSAFASQSIAYADFNNMRKLEQTNAGSHSLVYASSGLPIFGTGDTEKSSEAFHVRRGVIGGYSDYLSGEDIQFLQQTMSGKIAEMYGYKNGFWEG